MREANQLALLPLRLEPRRLASIACRRPLHSMAIIFTPVKHAIMSRANLISLNSNRRKKTKKKMRIKQLSKQILEHSIACRCRRPRLFAAVPLDARARRLHS